jgi:cell division topological specificity factor
MNFLARLFQLIGKEKSKETAKKRLQLVLIHDRTDISPETMENLRRDLIGVISNYLEIDEEKIELDLEKEERSVALVANIPIRTVKRRPERRAEPA